jgi:hypothetical protein
MGEFEIYDINPELDYVYNVMMNLYDRTFISKHITSEKGRLIRRIPFTNKSEFNFPSENTGEGFIQIWYIVLNNGRSYLFIVGTILTTPVRVGGYYGDINIEDIKHQPMERCLKIKTKTWIKMYAKRKTTLLIDEMNNLVNYLNEELN